MRFAAVLLAALLFAGAWPVGGSDAQTPRGALILGKTYGEWSVGWWQWQEANFPDFTFGEGEVDCALGQSGPVWFLGGTGGGAAERACAESLRRGTYLFIPLVNANAFDEGTIEEKRLWLDGLFSKDPPGPIDSVACDLQIDVDGVPAVYSTPIVRAQSPTPFPYAGDPESLADGFWVMLNPLAPGDHVIHFTGGFCHIDTGESLFFVDVTYEVTVR